MKIARLNGTLNGGNEKKKKQRIRRCEKPSFLSDAGDVASGDVAGERPDLTMALTGSTYVLHFNEPIFLVASSALFFIPAAIARNVGSHNLSALYCATAVVSINHWRAPCNGWRRNLDLTVAKLSFVATTISGLKTFRHPLELAVGSAMIFLIPVAYRLSIVLHARESPAWVYAHMAMHMFVAIGMSAVSW